MTLLGLLSAAFQRLQRIATDHASYQELRDLDPRLLRDIGLRLENGRIHPVDGVRERNVAAVDSADYLTVGDPQVESVGG